MNPSIALSPDQQYAYDKFVQGENILVMGPGGTGKTQLVKQMVQFTKQINKNIQVCAMTGCAAILLNCNARTIHSWSGIRLAKGSNEKVISEVIKNKKAMAAWKKASGLILDEVSMLSKKIFEIIEAVARIVKKSSLPFGGMQVIFTGDFFQLPPVGTHGEPDTELFCFESPVWSTVFKPENQIELTTMFRQTDPKYIEILQQIRKGNLDNENRDLLQTYLHRDLTTEHTPTKLFPIRSKVDYINNMMFAKLIDKEFVFELVRRTDCTTFIESGKPIPTDTIQRVKQMSIQEKEYELDHLTANIPCTQVLRLKKGAVVMCIVNLDMDQSICNGSQGIVIDMNENGPLVKFSNGVLKWISPHYWQSEENPCIAIGQYPLILSWAITIHKIQGATLDMAEIDIGMSIFEYGQTYVALSRIKSLEGLYLSAFQPERIKANPKVIEFYRKWSALAKPVLAQTMPVHAAQIIDETMVAQSVDDELPTIVDPANQFAQFQHVPNDPNIKRIRL